METYPAGWHLHYGNKTGVSAARIVSYLAPLFTPKSIVEIGCGNAHWTYEFIASGVSDYLVTDGPWNNIDNLLVDRAAIRSLDLNEFNSLGRKFDMAVCLEVAEHVQEIAAENIIRTLTEASDIVLFGAAIPLQGGYGHINEQWPSYWRSIFEKFGFIAFDIIRPKFWNDQDIHYWYRQNTFIYVRKTDIRNIDLLVREQAKLYETIPMSDAIHPEKFIEVSSYESLVLKRLIKRVPMWFIRRLSEKFRSLFGH